MDQRSPTAISLIITAVLLTGCGAGRAAPEGSSSGRELFARSCSGCHTLAGVDDPRRQGGDLLDFHARRAQLRQLAAEMPVWPPLRDAQLNAVVDYVMAVEGERRR